MGILLTTAEAGHARLLPQPQGGLGNGGRALGAAGAEGSVFLLPSVPGMVAKIFDAPSADNRRAKVETLISHPFYDPPAADGHRRFPAPQEILLDHATGEFVGHTMHLIPNADALDEFFDPLGKRYRGQLSFRVGLAISVAELLAEVSSSSSGDHPRGPQASKHISR